MSKTENSGQLVYLGAVTAEGPTEVENFDSILDDEDALIDAIEQRKQIEIESRQQLEQQQGAVVQVRRKLEKALRAVRRGTQLFVVNGISVVVKVAPDEPLSAVRDRVLAGQPGITRPFDHYIVKDQQGVKPPLNWTAECFNENPRKNLYIVPEAPLCNFCPEVSDGVLYCCPACRKERTPDGQN